MLRAALKPAGNDADDRRLVGPDTHNAACGIETRKHLLQDATVQGPDTHNAACGIETEEDSLLHRRTVEVPTHTMLRAVLTAKRLCVSTSVTQSRFRMRKAHSNLDDAAHRC